MPISREIWAEVGGACSGRDLKVAEAVAEFNPLDDFRQAVLTVELALFLLRGHHQSECHGEPGLAAQAALGSSGPMPDGGEGAFERV